MNFGEKIKKEILAKPIKDRCCKKAFLAGLIRGTGTLVYTNGNLGLDFFVSSEELAFHVAEYLKNIFDYDVSEVLISQDRLNKKERFAVCISGERAVEILQELEILVDDGGEKAVNLKFYGGLTKKECCLKAFMRGLFLSAGTCTVPSTQSGGKTGYHLELVFSHYAPAEDTAAVLIERGVTAKTTRRKDSYITYIKSVEEIKNFVAFLPAPVAVLSLIDLSINRELSNNSNRQKNCDIANVSRQIEATAKQVEAINKIIKLKGLNYLKKDLADTATAKLEYSDDTLSELAERLNVTKSCLNHRLRKLVAIAKEL